MIHFQGYAYTSFSSGRQDGNGRDPATRLIEMVMAYSGICRDWRDFAESIALLRRSPA